MSASGSSQQKNLFLIGPGFIGTTLLLLLKSARPDLKLHALTRREEQAKELQALDIVPIHGSLQDAHIIKEWSQKSDIVIHTATADDVDSAMAVVAGLTSRPADAPKAVYIHTSGNDELVNSAKGLAASSLQEKTISDAWTDEQLEQRIQPDAYHRQVDGPLREKLFNPEAEKRHNVVATIMMPPLIYGVGPEPWKRISIQIPMVAQAMLDKGPVTLPEGHPGSWNCVHVHDLARAYGTLLASLEETHPGEQRSHYMFPAEPEVFKWKDVLDTIVSQVKQSPKADKVDGAVRMIETQADFEEFVGGKDNPYSPCFGKLVWGKENSYTKPDRLRQLGFKHEHTTGPVDSITQGGELKRLLDGSVKPGPATVTS